MTAPLLTIADCLARLPVVMSERSFRQLVRRTGAYMEHRRQLMLTESDFAVVLEELRPCSNSSNGVRSGTSAAPSAIDLMTNACTGA